MLQQYETLRRDAVDAAVLEHPGRGLALLLSRGMGAWLKTLAHLGSPVGNAVEDPDGAAPNLSPSTRSDLTLILADMVLACNGSCGDE